jgi:hypothetical protein
MCTGGTSGKCGNAQRVHAAGTTTMLVPASILIEFMSHLTTASQPHERNHAWSLGCSVQRSPDLQGLSQAIGGQALTLAKPFLPFLRRAPKGMAMKRGKRGRIPSSQAVEVACNSKLLRRIEWKGNREPMKGGSTRVGSKLLAVGIMCSRIAHRQNDQNSADRPRLNFWKTGGY